MSDDLRLESLFLGNRISLESGGGLLSKFFLPMGNLMGHVFICGSPACGKTVFAKSIIEEAAQKEVPSIIIDLKGDLSSLCLLFDKTSPEYFEFFSEEYGQSEDWRDRARQEFDNQMRHLGRFGLTEDYVKRLKDTVEVAVFTPRSKSGIPLAISLLPPAPENIKELYDKERENIFTAIDFLISALIGRLYVNEEINQKDREKNFLSELILYSWLNGIEIHGIKGLARFIDLIDHLPLAKVGDAPVDEYIPEPVRKLLADKLREHLNGAERIWYDGVPLDIDLFSQRFDKTPINIINLSELETFEDRYLVISQVAYSIYCWMKKQGPSDRPRLIFYIDEIGSKRSFLSTDPFHFVARPAIELLLRESKNSGVCCVLATQYLEDIDFKGINDCDTWVIGKLSTNKEKEKILENGFQSGVKFDKLATFLDILDNEQFLIKLRSGEVILVKTRRVASFHRILPPSLISMVMSRQVQGNYKTFYLSGKEATGQEGEQARTTVLLPETIFEGFNFGIARGEPFILDIEPEEVIKLCLAELAKEGIPADEARFRNVQLLITRVHRADWKINTLKRDSLGNVVDRVKDEGKFCRFDAPLKLEKEAQDKLVEIVLAREDNRRSAQLWEKVAVLLPTANRLSEIDVKSHVGREMNIHPKEVAVNLIEKNVAVAWKIAIDYNKKIIDFYFDILRRELKAEFPAFSKQEAITEIKKIFPDLDLKEENIEVRGFLYILNYNTADYNYTFKVNKKSGKVVNQKKTISETRVKQIAKENASEEPLAIWQQNNMWNFYYPKGMILVVEDESEKVTLKKYLSAPEADDLAVAAAAKESGEKYFLPVRKDFKNGRWIISLASKKWSALAEIEEDASVKLTLRLLKDYCYQEAQKILANNKITVITGEETNPWHDGWEFQFLSSLGYLIIKVDSQKQEFIKERLTHDGAAHFAGLAIGGEVISVKDADLSWSVGVKKGGKKYYVQLNKQDGSVQKVTTGNFLFRKPVDINGLTGTPKAPGSQP